MLTDDQFRTLARAEGERLVSIHLPTHVAGPQTRQGPIQLENALSHLRDALGDDEHTKAFLAPLRDKVDDRDFWQHQSHGLALFLAPDRELEVHHLGHEVDEVAHVGRRFVVRPLLPSITRGQRFEVLAISENSVRLFECTRRSAHEAPLGPIPGSLVEALGGDKDEPTLQHHTTTHAGSSHKPAAAFHGHGSGKDADDVDLERFLRAIDRGIGERFAGTWSAPLVIAGVNETLGEFRRLTRHDRVVDEGLRGNVEHLDARAIHERALPIVTPLLDAERDGLLAQVTSRRGTDRVLDDLDAIVEAAGQGRIETLFVQSSAAAWGEPPHSRLDLPPTLDRVEDAVHATCAHGGSIEALRPDELGDTRVIASLRA